MIEFNCAIVITTCPRDEPTFKRSKESLKKSLKNYSGYSISVSDDKDKTIGCFSNFDKALKMAIDEDKEFCMVAQDDMIYSSGWVHVVKKRDWKDVGFLSIYNPKGLGERYGMQSGFYRTYGGWGSSWGACYLFKTSTAKKLIRHNFYNDHLYGRIKHTGSYINYEKNKRIDHCVPEVIHLLSMKQIFHSPSLCEHIGNTSTIGNIHTDANDPYKPKDLRLYEADGWSIEKDHLKEIIEFLKPSIQVVEFGSGKSTEVLSQYCDLLSFEHNPEYRTDLNAYRPLKDGWYNLTANDKRAISKADVIVLDGPTAETGRYNIPKEIILLFKKQCVIFVDDCHREKDLELAKMIAKLTKKKLTLMEGKQKSMAKIK